MNVDEAVIVLVVAYAAGSIIMLPLTRWLLRREVIAMIDELADTLFGKAKMSELGTKSGEKRHQKALMDQMASDVLDSPQLKGVKGIASAVGIDIESYINEHGAADTIATATSIANMLGIDIMKVMSEGLNTSGESSSGTSNPYLK